MAPFDIALRAPGGAATFDLSLAGADRSLSASDSGAGAEAASVAAGIAATDRSTTAPVAAIRVEAGLTTGGTRIVSDRAVVYQNYPGVLTWYLRYNAHAVHGTWADIPENEYIIGGTSSHMAVTILRNAGDPIIQGKRLGDDTNPYTVESSAGAIVDELDGDTDTPVWFRIRMSPDAVTQDVALSDEQLDDPDDVFWFDYTATTYTAEPSGLWRAFNKVASLFTLTNTGGASDAAGDLLFFGEYDEAGGEWLHRFDAADVDRTAVVDAGTHVDPITLETWTFHVEAPGEMTPYFVPDATTPAIAAATAATEAGAGTETAGIAAAIDAHDVSTPAHLHLPGQASTIDSNQVEANSAPFPNYSAADGEVLSTYVRLNHFDWGWANDSGALYYWKGATSTRLGVRLLNSDHLSFFYHDGTKYLIVNAVDQLNTFGFGDEFIWLRHDFLHDGTTNQIYWSRHQTRLPEDVTGWVEMPTAAPSATGAGWWPNDVAESLFTNQPNSSVQANQGPGRLAYYRCSAPVAGILGNWDAANLGVGRADDGDTHVDPLSGQTWETLVDTVDSLEWVGPGESAVSVTGAISGADAGVGDETTAGVAAALSGAESGSAAERATVSAGLAGSDSGAGTETSSPPAAALDSTDSGTGAESVSPIAVSLDSADSGVGSFSTILAAAIVAVESGTGIDVSALVTALLGQIGVAAGAVAASDGISGAATAAGGVSGSGGASGGAAGAGVADDAAVADVTAVGGASGSVS